MTRHPAAWEQPDRLAAPSGGDIHIVRLPLAGDRGDLLRAVLSVDERERADRFRFDRDRGRFIAARAGLRQILGACLNSDPRELVFEYGSQGKPALAGSGSLLQFNLSHSGDMAVYALADGREIGIDIERLDAQRDNDGIANRFFTAVESKTLSMIPNERRHLAFTQLWVRKEAFLKAQGQGLFMSLDGMEISVGHEAPRIIALPDEPSADSSWFISDIDADPDYASAVVVSGPEGVIRGYTWNAGV